MRNAPRNALCKSSIFCRCDQGDVKRTGLTTYLRGNSFVKQDLIAWTRTCQPLYYQTGTKNWSLDSQVFVHSIFLS